MKILLGIILAILGSRFHEIIENMLHHEQKFFQCGLCIYWGAIDDMIKHYREFHAITDIKTDPPIMLGANFRNKYILFLLACKIFFYDMYKTKKRNVE